MLAAFAAAEAALGLVLLIIGVVRGNGLYIGGGVLLLAIAARTDFRRRAARRLARRPPP